MKGSEGGSREDNGRKKGNEKIRRGTEESFKERDRKERAGEMKRATTCWQQLTVLLREAWGDPRRGPGSGRLPKTFGYCFSAAAMIRPETTCFSRPLPTSPRLHDEPGLALA